MRFYRVPLSLHLFYPFLSLSPSSEIKGAMATEGNAYTGGRPLPKPIKIVGVCSDCSEGELVLRARPRVMPPARIVAPRTHPQNGLRKFPRGRFPSEVCLLPPGAWYKFFIIHISQRSRKRTSKRHSHLLLLPIMTTLNSLKEKQL